jgi:hypothetical protein
MKENYKVWVTQPPPIEYHQLICVQVIGDKGNFHEVIELNLKETVAKLIQKFLAKSGFKFNVKDMKIYLNTQDLGFSTRRLAEASLLHSKTME